MNFIEKLESFQQKLVGFELYGFATDLQNIIEEYKNAQEPVAWRAVNKFGDASRINEGLPSESLIERMKESPDKHIEYLFTHPPLSDETVKEWKPLSDVQWMNIVNYGNAWNGWSKEEAVHEVVKMTEAKCKENNAETEANKA